MSVWLTIPSARPVEEAEPIFRLWMKQGYKIAILIDRSTSPTPPEAIVRGYADAVLSCYNEGYPGYAASVNRLIDHVMDRDPGAEWFVIGGDDVEPDLNHSAEEIAREGTLTFTGKFYPDHPLDLPKPLGTFGVMQPTGDRFAGGSIDRIAGSAWIGREFARRINQGNGPLWPEYHHMFVDEELQNVAIKYGCFWQRPDLIQLHHHFMRAHQGEESHAVVTTPPKHLLKWNTKEHWNESKAIFQARKAAGFPGSEPIA